jgi:outer membrane lipoprotein-sorting protein
MTILFRIAVMAMGALLAQDAAPPAASDKAPEPAPPTPPGQVDGGARLSQDATVDQVLDALHDRGVGLKDFTADVKLAETDPTLGDTTSRKGTAVYQKKGDGDARIRVVFDSKQQGRKIYNQKIEYVLDDGWLVERDFARKTEVRRQVLRPGEKVDLLKLGEGPFPLPVGQTKESVEKLFEVKKVAADPKHDPADTVHVQLTPRPDTRFARKFQTIDVWVDTKTEMPKRIETLDANGTSQRTTDLDVTSVNAGVKDGDFVLEPVGPDWNRHDEPFEE